MSDATVTHLRGVLDTSTVIMLPRITNVASLPAERRAALLAEGTRMVTDKVAPARAGFVTFMETEYVPHAARSLAASDLGDVYPRQVQFFPASGKVRVRQLLGTRDAQLVDGERFYLKRLANDPIKGEVELF